MNDRRYPLSWTMKIENPPLSAGDVEAREVGACDVLFFASIVHSSRDIYGTILGSLDGRTGKGVDDSVLFEVWAMLAEGLGRSSTLGEGRRTFCAEVFRLIGEAKTREAAVREREAVEAAQKESAVKGCS